MAVSVTSFPNPLCLCLGDLLDPGAVLTAYVAGRDVISPLAVSTSLRVAAVNAVWRLGQGQCITDVYREWSGWLMPRSHVRATYYGDVMGALLGAIYVQLHRAHQRGWIERWSVQLTFELS